MAVHVSMDKDASVRKVESIVKARYSLGPLAVKFITMIIASLSEKDSPLEEYVFRVSDFKELLGLKGRSVYENVDKAAKELLSNPLKIPIHKPGEPERYLRVNWISSADYDSGRISFMIDPRLKPILLEAKNRFLRYRVENILFLKSSYSIRMYEILKDELMRSNRYGKSAEVVFDLEELKTMIGFPDKCNYGGKGGFKDRVVERARKELFEKTDIYFEYEEIKTGRRVEALRFKIFPNKKSPKKLP